MDETLNRGMSGQYGVPLYCPNCGASNGNDKRFCTNCGAPLPVNSHVLYSQHTTHANGTHSGSVPGARVFLGVAVIACGLFLILSAFLTWFSSSGTLPLSLSGSYGGFNLSSSGQVGVSLEVSGVNILANSQVKDVATLNIAGKKLNATQIDELFQQSEQGNQSSSLNDKLFSSGSPLARWTSSPGQGIVFFPSGLWPILFGICLLVLGGLLMMPVRMIGIPIGVIGILGVIVSLVTILTVYSRLSILTGNSYGLTVSNSVGVGLWLFMVFSALASAAGWLALKYA